MLTDAFENTIYEWDPWPRIKLDRQSRLRVSQVIGIVFWLRLWIIAFGFWTRKMDSNSPGTSLIYKLTGVSYKGHVNSEYRIQSCFSRNDAHVISGSEDGKIYTWDLVEGEIISHMEAHSRAVTCVRYNPKRHELLSSSLDGSVRVWVNDAQFASFMASKGA